MLSLQTLQQQHKERGLAIVNNNRNLINRIDDFSYTVHSQSGNGNYLISLIEEGWICECPERLKRIYDKANLKVLS